MILERDPAALRSWMQDAAAGRGPLLPGDSTPWDAFYAEYRRANAALRQHVDDVVRGLAASPEVEVRAAVLAHWYEADRTVGYAEFERLLADEPALYAAQKAEGASETLRSRLIGGLAAQADGDAARGLLLAHVHDVDPLPPRVGTYFGGLGAEATDALVGARSDAGMTRAIHEAGYALHHSPAEWADAVARAARWPAPMRDALAAGARDHGG